MMRIPSHFGSIAQPASRSGIVPAEAASMGAYRAGRDDMPGTDAARVLSSGYPLMTAGGPDFRGSGVRVLQLQLPLQRISRGARGETAGEPSKASEQSRMDADPKVLSFGVVDGEERCAGASHSARRAVLRALAVPSRGLRVNLLPFQG